MIEYKLGEIEMRFAKIIWGNEPLSSRELSVLANEMLNWNRLTTYTILRRLSQRGLFQNIDGVVTSIISLDEFISGQSSQFINDNFSGSIPNFLTAFTMNNKLSQQQISEIQKFINDCLEEK